MFGILQRRSVMKRGFPRLLCTAWHTPIRRDVLSVRWRTMNPSPYRCPSWPHAEKTEDEFINVIEGTPDVWLDGALHRLQAGDGVGFSAGDGMAHTFINITQTDVRLLVVGDVSREDNQFHYPLHPQRNAALEGQHWAGIPARSQGPHDGLPDALRRACTTSDGLAPPLTTATTKPRSNNPCKRHYNIGSRRVW